MLIGGMCIPCTLTRGKGVLVANGAGFTIMEGFKEYVEACIWWNTHIAGKGTQYKKLLGYKVRQAGIAADPIDKQFIADETALEVCIQTESDGEKLLTVDKSTGRINSSTCKESFQSFVADWNMILGVDVSQPSIVLGSIFNDLSEVLYD